MNAKEYLSQAYYLDREINRKLKRIMFFREMASNGSGILQAQRVSGTEKHSPMEDAITKIIDLEEEVNADIDRLVDLKREMIRMIHALPQLEHRLLLQLRYLNYKRWEEIAATMQHDLKAVHWIHARALHRIEIPDSAKGVG